MARYERPSGDRERLRVLKRTFATGPQDIASGNPYVSQETLNAIADFLPGFEAAVDTVGEKLGTRVKEVRERAAAIDLVIRYTRDLWAVLKRRANRLGEPADVLTFYRLPLDGVSPNPTNRGQWLILAAQVAKGDANAVAAGYPAMINPSAAELQQVLDAARSEYDDVAMADRAYGIAQKAVYALRPRADELIAEVMAELRFNLRKRDTPYRRRIMRTYGAVYSYLVGEPEDEVDAAVVDDVSAEAEI